MEARPRPRHRPRRRYINPVQVHAARVRRAIEVVEVSDEIETQVPPEYAELLGITTLVCTTIGGGLAGLVELRLGKPGKRSSFRRRHSGSMVATILSMLIAGAFGAAAAVAVLLLG